MADLHWLTDVSGWSAKARRWAPIAGAVALVLFWLVFDWWFLLSLILALAVAVLVVWFTQETVVPPPVTAPAPQPVATPAPAPAPAAVVAPVPPVAPAPVDTPSEVDAADVASARVRSAAQAAGEAARMMAEPAAATRPVGLDGPRDGGGDDLKQIKGIGPKLEAMLHRLGYYHYDQIAAWTPEEVVWVDANLEEFSGRATRDGWVEQARVLARGDMTGSSTRVDRGEVRND